MPSCDLPAPRGPITEWLFARLRGGSVPAVPTVPPFGVARTDDDLHLALYCCYELHYRGFRGVEPELEWDPDVLALRAALEARFLEELERSVQVVAPASPAGAESCLLALATGGDGPSLSQEVQRSASMDQVRELCIHRSAYQLKEADPHTWAIPRLHGEAKAAAVEIQADEYGNGKAASMHASLFADTLRAVGLDPTYGAYLDRIPGVTLATTNLISLFGLHRRWRGALVGHLALFEMTSVGPMGRYADALEQLGVGPEGRAFYEVHVEADEEHQHIALERMVRGLLREEPELARDVVFGAAALTEIEGRLADHLRASWRAGRSSLLPATATESMHAHTA